MQLPSGREIQAGSIAEVGPPGRTVVEFRYTSQYLNDVDAYAISPELPLTGGSFTPAGRRTMLGGISDAQPDTWGRRIIDAERREAARASKEVPRRATELDVLVAVPDLTRQGALRLTLDGAYVSGRVTPTATIVDLGELVEAARAFEDNKEVPEQLRRLVGAGTSAGGARPKATVRNSEGRLAIAKLPRDDDFGDAMAWEATALELSRRAGVMVPPFKLHRVGYRSVLVVERFDREGEKRIGYLSADSLLRKQPGEFVDYTTLAEAVAPLSASPRKDGEELFRRIAVTLLVNNIDDHMKNHGLLREQNGWGLSPVFDVNPHYRHGTAESTPVSARDDPARRDIRNLLAAADSFSITSDQAAAIVLEVERATSDWRGVAASFGIEHEGADAMAQAFENENRQRAKELRSPDSNTTQKRALGRQPRTIKGRFDFKDNSGPEATLPGR